METKPVVTRIDLEAIGEGITRVSKFLEGWSEGTPAETSEMVKSSIVRLLMEYEKQGFTCEMCDSLHGRALRGAITRIDFEKILNVWHVKKYPYGWTAKTRPLSDTAKTESEIETAIQWCEQNGWTVRRRHDGARAWKGQPVPVHDKRTILAMRRRTEANPELGTNKTFADFAYDY